MMAETGYVVGSRYQVGDSLGVGGMCEVHRGRDLRLHRDVAIKVLLADLARDPSLRARFRREAQTAASLNHPAIVVVYDTGDTGDRGDTEGKAGTLPYIVMEYVDGETLRDVLEKEGPLPPRRAGEIVADICGALDFSHRRGLVHGDIKPANVMLNRAGAVKVMDFCIARSVVKGQPTVTTATAGAISTAQYMSPEQAGGGAVDARSDVYATGCLLYELLCGVPPFTGDSSEAIAHQHEREAAQPPSEIKPGLPKEMDAIVLKALNKSPLNRYQTAADMRLDLIKVLSGQAVQATLSTSDHNRTELIQTAPAGVGALAPSLLAPPLLAPPLLAPPLLTPPLLTPPNRSTVTDQDRAPDDSGRSKRLWGVVGAAVLCVALLAGGIWLTLRVIGAPPPIALVTVPDLAGTPLDQATTTLEAKGLTVGTITIVDSTDAMTGMVVGQRPSNHTEVRNGSLIDLDIGRGVSTALVPDVVGNTAAAAKQAITNAHLVYAEQRKPSSDADQGKVIAQDPPPQTQATPNATVTATIGTGLTMVAVPNGVVGKSLDEATRILKAAKLTVVTQDGDGVEPRNQVIRMDQRPGQRIPEGTPITLTISNNRLMIMPNLQNQTRDRAVAILRAQGWAGDASSLTVTEQATAKPAQIGAILAQRPNAGSAVHKIGTPVTVTVGVRQITVPDLIGKTQPQAAALLTKAGATNVTFTDAGTPPRGQANRVQGQSVPPKAAVPANTAIVVNVYKN